MRDIIETIRQYKIHYIKPSSPFFPFVDCDSFCVKFILQPVCLQNERYCVTAVAITHTPQTRNVLKEHSAFLSAQSLGMLTVLAKCSK